MPDRPSATSRTRVRDIAERRGARRNQHPRQTVACLVLLALAIGWLAVDSRAEESAWKPTHFVLLDTGPGDRSGTTPEEMGKLQTAHLANLGRLATEDKSRLAGPLGRESKKTRGIVILSLADGVNVADEFANDPFMKAEFLAVRAYPWQMTTGRLKKPHEMTAMGEYCTVFVKRRKAAERTAAMAAYKKLEAELRAWKLEDGKQPLALAGPVDSDDGLIGIMIFRIEELRAVRAALRNAAATDPETLEHDVFRQYFGADLID